MIKVSRKVGITIALAGLLCAGGIANNAKKIKFGKLNSDLRIGVNTCQQFGGVIFKKDALIQLAQSEYQLFLAEFYSRHNEYQKGQDCFLKAISRAKESLGATSFLTFIAFHRKGEIEQKQSKFVEAHEDYKAALEALPNREEYDYLRCLAEYSVISTAANKTKKENIPFYRQHLALTEKLADQFTNRDQNIYALWILGKALDDGAQYSESEPIWNRMISEARAENLQGPQFGPWLYEFSYHEVCAEHYPEAERALWEAMRVAAQANDDRMAADVLEAKADLRLRQNDLQKAENGLSSALALRKKFSDDLKLSYTYWGLSEVARRRGDLTKREAYLKVAMELTDAPGEKAQLLKSLAVIAAQNKRTPEAKEYVEQWKTLSKTNQTEQPFIFEKDLKNLLVLYPELNKTDEKGSPSEIADSDFSNLQVQKVGPHRHGYYLTEKQLERLMDAIGSTKSIESKK